MATALRAIDPFRSACASRGVLRRSSLPSLKRSAREPEVTAICKSFNEKATSHNVWSVYTILAACHRAQAASLRGRHSTCHTGVRGSEAPRTLRTLTLLRKGSDEATLLPLWLIGKQDVTTVLRRHGRTGAKGGFISRNSRKRPPGATRQNQILAGRWTI